MAGEGPDRVEEYDVPWWDFVRIQLFFLVNNTFCRVTDLALLLLRPRLFGPYLALWWAAILRSPYRWPRSFEAVRAVKASGQSLRELVYGETPLLTGVWLLRRAGMKRGDRLLDLGAGRGRLLLAARWLGVEARGVELLAAHVEPAARAIQRAGATLEVGDATQVELGDATHVYLPWTGFLPATEAKVVERLRRARPGTKVISLTRPIAAPGLRLLSTHRGVFTWGIEGAFVHQVE